MKNIIKILLVLLGNGILVYGIVTEIDGIGRFAMIMFGVLSSLIGSFINFKK